MRFTTRRFVLPFLSFILSSWSSSKTTPCIAWAFTDDAPEEWVRYRPIAKIRRRTTTTNPSIEEEEEDDAQFSLTNYSSTTLSSLPDDIDYNNAPHSSNLIHRLNFTITELAEIGGPLASLALILAVALADSIPCIPSQPVAVLSGAVFGFWKGILPFEIGQILAIILCMAVGRFVRKRKRTNDTSHHYTRSGDSKLNQILQELTVGLNSKNWGKVFCTIVIARQSPVLPFSLGNYFVGAATSAPLVPAVLGTVVGVFPGNVMLVGAGAGGVALLRSNSFVGTALEIVGVISTIVLFYAFYKAVRKVLCNAGDNADKETEENIPLLERPTSPPTQTSVSSNAQSDMTHEVATSA